MVITEAPPDTVDAAGLLARAQAGDAEAFCELAQGCEQRLFQQAIALCRNPATAEDLTAETLVEAWKSLARFDGSCRFSTWLYAILLHRFQKWSRQARSRPVPMASLKPAEGADSEALLELAPDDRPFPAEALLRKEQSAALRAAIESLPPKHQQVVRLRFYEGASIPEIAGALGLSLGTVKSRLHYALEKLRQMKSVVNLSGEGGDTEV